MIAANGFHFVVVFAVEIDFRPIFSAIICFIPTRFCEKAHACFHTAPDDRVHNGSNDHTDYSVHVHNLTLSNSMLLIIVALF